MKRFSLLLSAAFLCVVCALLPVCATTEGTCQLCEKSVTWAGLSTIADDATTISAGHYIYDYSEDSHTWSATKTISGTVCIQIPEGKTLCGITQLFCVPKNTALNIQGDGTLIAGGFAEGTTWTSRNGGILQVSAGGSVHIYGCSYKVALANTTALKPYNGGLIYNLGTVNIHGGTFTGSSVGGVGSAIFAGPSSALNFYSGNITGNTPAVCAQGTISLNGDPQISQIQLRYKSGSPTHG